MERPKIVGIGELLWDMLPRGRRMGGAPVNFAFYAREEGADAHVISAVGEDEPGRECASRELEEETGYRSENLEWLITLRTTVAFCNERIEVYVAKDLIPSKQHLDEDEFIDLKAYSIEELKEKILTGEIEDAKTVASLMAYAVKYSV